MEDIILGIIGAAAAVFGVILLIKMLMLRKNGVYTSGEVVAAEQDNKKRYYHTLKYTVNGREHVSKDRSGYSNPFEQGAVKAIVCEPDSPESFRYTEELTANLIASVCCIVIGIGFVLRFIVF